MTRTGRPPVHGQSKLPEFQVWLNMMSRCYNPSNRFYKNYGGRGIQVCAEWHDPKTFIEAVGPRPSPKHHLDRYPNNDGDYEPTNWRWTSPTDNIRNRSNTVQWTHPETRETKPLAQWAEEFDIPYTVFRDRVNKNWPIERLSDPVREVGPKRHQTVTLNGSTKTLMQWCKELGRNYATVVSRVERAGMSYDEALEKVTGMGRGEDRLITWKGETKSIGTWSQITGLDRGVIYMRDTLGWSAEEIFTTPVRKKG